MKPIRALLAITLVLAALQIGSAIANITTSGMFITFADITTLISTLTTFFGLVAVWCITEFFAHHVKTLIAVPKAVPHGSESRGPVVSGGLTAEIPVQESFAPPPVVTALPSSSLRP